MSAEELEHELVRAAHETYKSDLEYIKADEYFREKDDARKSVFAVIQDAMFGKTSAEKERLALIDASWGEWLKEFARIRLEARNKRILRDNWLRRWETVRSLLSSRNTSRRTGI
jgi:hypothetical protein